MRELTTVILTPGACEGGSEQQVMTPDPLDPLDRRNEFQIAHFVVCFTVLGDSGDALVQCFFLICSCPSQLKPILLRAFLECICAKSGLKSKCFAWEVPRKVKNIHTILPFRPKVIGCCSQASFWEFIPGSCGSRGNDVRARCLDSPFTRAGGQDDVSSRDNSLKLVLFICFVMTTCTTCSHHSCWEEGWRQWR